MEGSGPYRIYDPGGGAEASAAYERLVEENSRLKEKMQGMKTLGQLLGESQMEASRLRQKAEALVGNNSPPLSPPSPSSAPSEPAPLAGKDTSVPSSPAPVLLRDTPELAPKPPSSGSSSEFELVFTEEQKPPGRAAVAPPEARAPASEDLQVHLQRLESTLSVCAQEPDHSQLFTHLSRMALEFNRLAAKVHSNERRTAVLQTLCEQLRQENEVLKAKLDKGLEQRSQATERLREENEELRLLLGKKSAGEQQQAVGTAAKSPEVGTAEKKVKMLEQQRLELLEVNKQWDQHFRSMKQQYEQKITELRQKLAAVQKQVTELEAEREQKQRDFDRKLLLAKSKIEMEETDKEHRAAEAQELRQEIQALQDQLGPLARQRDYQEREIQRLNKALEEALSIQASPPTPTAAFGGSEAGGGRLRKQELVTQNELLKQQVKIFEEDFRKERSDRERMNEEKEELRRQLEQLQAQVASQVLQDGEEREPRRRPRLKAKAPTERVSEHLCGACPCAHPVLPAMLPAHGYEDWAQIHYPPAPPVEHSPPLPSSCVFRLPEYPWRPPCTRLHHQSPQVPGSPTARPADPAPTQNELEDP
ncbi:TNFAIP3-interacting protein 1 isoform X2 [Suncus etruscus]|uniref:TNFAIP3-interacting protein 1 isoform X2 n=1 Tax=Suncus etruscus TaxID=109475 RepID=UPI00210FE803|nr:TNFAIP3-interacting protein 1 isoform X2 [Suncus etruscus]